MDKNLFPFFCTLKNTLSSTGNGLFSAELTLDKYMCAEERKRKKVVLKVADTMLQIFCVKKQEDEKEEEKRNVKQDENKKENKKGKQNGNAKNWSSGRLKKFKIGGTGDKKKVKKEVLNENELQPYGYISLPNYIIIDTLQVSINVFGNLQIAARMKGVRRWSLSELDHT